MVIELKCYPILNGIMAWWSSVEDAARYIVTLYINDAPISEKIVERTEKYYSFTGLAAISHRSPSIYYIKVQAENRNGEIIAESDKIKSTVREI